MTRKRRRTVPDIYLTIDDVVIVVLDGVYSRDRECETEISAVEVSLSHA